MMTLSTMRAVVDALDDTYASPVADKIVASWAHDPGSVKYLRASANFVFTYRHEGKPYILRFNHERERSAGTIHAELDFIRHLEVQGVYVAQPVFSLSGRESESVDTTGGRYHAVSFGTIRGEQFEVEELSLPAFATWGRALGELHNASQGYQKPGRSSWQDHLDTVGRALPVEERSGRRLLGTVKDRLSRLPKGEKSFGLIHFDCELDNLIWQGNRVGVVDLDDCAYYWFVADIAFALRDLFGDRPDGVDPAHEGFRAFVSGYREVRGISDEELALIPLLVAAHNLITYVKVRRTLGAAPQDSEPAWLTALRGKLEKKAQTYREGFTYRPH